MFATGIIKLILCSLRLMTIVFLSLTATPNLLRESFVRYSTIRVTEDKQLLLVVIIG